MTEPNNAHESQSPENAGQQAGSSAATAGYTATREGLRLRYAGLNDGWHEFEFVMGGKVVRWTRTAAVSIVSAEDVMRQVAVDLDSALKALAVTANPRPQEAGYTATRESEGVRVEYLGYENGWYSVRATKGEAVSCSKVSPPPAAKSPDDVVFFVMDTVRQVVAAVQGAPIP